MSEGSLGLPVALFLFVSPYIQKASYPNSADKNHPTTHHRTNTSDRASPQTVHIASHLITLLNSVLLMFLVIQLILYLAGNIHPDPGPVHLKTNELSVIHSNVCSLRYKTDFVLSELKDYILTISESWLLDEITSDQITLKVSNLQSEKTGMMN